MNESDFEFGIHCLGVGSEQCLQITKELSKGKLPEYMLEQIIKDEKYINSFKVNKYPWDKNVFNEMANGFEKIADTKSVLEHAENFFKKHKRKLSDFSKYENPHEKIANLLEKYMLTQLYVRGKKNE